MIRHLELLERYLTSEFDQEKARKHMMHIYARFLAVAEAAIFLSVTPAAFIASSGCLLWMILTCIHILPRWRECGLKLWKFFLPLPIMAAVTILLMPFMIDGINKLFDNFVVFAKSPVTVILLIALVTMAYSLHNAEKADRPDITMKKRAVEAALVIYLAAFSIDTPLRSLIVRLIS